MLFHPKAYKSALNLRSDACVKKGHPSKHHKCATVAGKASLYCVESVVATRGRTENNKGIYKSLRAPEMAPRANEEFEPFVVKMTSLKCLLDFKILFNHHWRATCFRFLWFVAVDDIDLAVHSSSSERILSTSVS